MMNFVLLSLAVGAAAVTEQDRLTVISQTLMRRMSQTKAIERTSGTSKKEVTKEELEEEEGDALKFAAKFLPENCLSFIKLGWKLKSSNALFRLWIHNSENTNLCRFTVKCPWQFVACCLKEQSLLKLWHVGSERENEIEAIKGKEEYEYESTSNQSCVLRYGNYKIFKNWGLNNDGDFWMYTLNEKTTTSTLTLILPLNISGSYEDDLTIISHFVFNKENKVSDSNKVFSFCGSLKDFTETALLESMHGKDIFGKHNLWENFEKENIFKIEEEEREEAIVPVEKSEEEKFHELEVQSFNTFMKNSQGGIEHGWTNPITNSNGVEISKLIKENLFDVIRAKVVIDAPIELINDWLSKHENKLNWDQMAESQIEIESFGDDSKILYMKYKGPWPSTPRDFVCILGRRYLDDSTICIHSSSVAHPDKPERSDYVRGECISGGFLLKRLSEHRTHLTYISQANLGGSLPMRIQNFVAQTQCQCAHLVKKFTEELQKNNPWNETNTKLVTVSKINYDGVLDLETTEINELQTATDMSKISPYESVFESSMLNSTFSSLAPYNSTPNPSIVGENLNLSKFEDQDKDKENRIFFDVTSILSNRSTKVSEQNISFRKSKPQLKNSAILTTAASECISDVLEDISLLEAALNRRIGCEQWTSFKHQGEISVYRKDANTKDKVDVLVASLDFDHSAERVYSYLADMENRLSFDNLLRSVTILDKIDGHTHLVKVYFESRNCILKTGREMLLIQRCRKLSQGKYIIASKSVDMDDLSKKNESVVRSWLHYGGYLIEEDPKQITKCKVTYVSKYDLCGRVPDKLKTMVARRQPAILLAIRTELAKLER